MRVQVKSHFENASYCLVSGAHMVGKVCILKMAVNAVSDAHLVGKVHL